MGCICTGPGECPFFRRRMSMRSFALCRERPEYRRLFRRLWAPDAAPDPPPTLPAVGAGSPVRTWAVGVTTAPRREPTLGRCIASVRAAGFEPRIFAEPDSPIPHQARGLPVSWRESRAGPWPNYFLGLVELLVRAPAADAYLMLQDDVILYPGEAGVGLRAWLEEALWPHDDVGAVSLYTSRRYAAREAGWNRVQRSWTWGACAMLWPRARLVEFVGAAAARKLRRGLTPQTWRNIEHPIASWQRWRRRSIWAATPSLAQHVGETSTIWSDRATATGNRRASRYAGDEPVRLGRRGEAASEAVAALAAALRAPSLIRNPQAGQDPCAHRGRRVAGEACRCRFACLSPERGGTCTLDDCQRCEHYE